MSGPIRSQTSLVSALSHDSVLPPAGGERSSLKGEGSSFRVPPPLLINIILLGTERSPDPTRLHAAA